MNKRQKKKYEKKIEEFTECYVSSYRELRELERSYHEYMVAYNHRPYDDIWDMYLDEFEDA